MLVPLQFAPGVLANGTIYQSKGRWRAAHLVRFAGEVKAPVGGWLALPMTGASISGITRTLLGWRADQHNTPLLAIGTYSHLYTFEAGTVTDRTIDDLTAGTADTELVGNRYGTGNYGAGLYGRGDPTQAAETPPGTWHLDTFGSYLVALLNADGRLLIWDTATDTLQPVSNTGGVGILTRASGALADGDTITIGAKTYTWQTFLTNVDGNVALGASLSDSLANMAAAINLDGVAGTQYAALMTKHTLVSAVSTATTLTVTQLVFGTATIATTETIVDAGITWGDSDLQGGVTGDAPTTNRGVVVTAERFIMALGANGGALSSTGGDRTVAWSSQETTDDWTATEVNTAGDFPLPGSGRLVCGRRGRGETLLFTETDLFSAQYVGGDLVYRFNQLGTNCGIIGPNAVAVVEGRAAWMGTRSFYIYEGAVTPVLGDVVDYVFSDFNRAQQVKCFTSVMADQNEVWFHYCSGVATEPDRYVIWNYAENHWTPGGLSRTASTPKGAFEFPLMITEAGVIYQHENGTVHTGEELPFLESGPLEIGTGDRVMQVLGLVPDDLTQQASGRSVSATLATAFFPNDTEVSFGPYTLESPTDIRVTARTVRLRIDAIAEDAWRLGTVRLDIVPTSER